MGRMLAGTALALALVAPAQAVTTQPPSLGVKAFTLTADQSARKPDVGVDANGTGHFFWNVNKDGGDDPAEYCQVPRGATACARTQVFDLPLEAFGEPQVIVTGSTVILIAYRGYGKGEGAYAIVSNDGGTTFAAPKLIADNVEPGQAVYGPGTGVVSLTDDVITAGVHYQAASLDRYTEANAHVGDGPNLQGYDGTVGFPSPNIPIVAFDDLTNGFWREWSGSGDPNDLSTWSAERPLGPATELRMGTGFKGVVLMAREDVSSGVHVYTARRFDPAADAFGASTRLSDPAIEPDVIQRDISEDAGGNIAAVWIANGEHGSLTDPLRYRASVDGGKTWQPERTLVATNDNGFNVQMGAAPDGGGFAVYDDNDQGPIVAVPIPPLSAQGGGGAGGAGGACVPSVGFGQVQALALTGCLTKQKDGTYLTHDSVRLNGLDLVPEGAAGAITIDPAHKQVHIDHADVRVGSIVLDKGSFDWSLAAGAPPVTFDHLEKFHVTFFGFPVVGTAELDLSKDGATVPVNVQLPAFFDGITGRLSLKLHNPGGLSVDGLEIKVANADFGALRVKELDVLYKGSQPPVFDGNAIFELPPNYGKAGDIHVAFGFVDGKFEHAEGSFPLQLPLFPPWIYLQKIGLALSAGPPLSVGGGVEVSAGPQLLGETAFSVDALPDDGGGFSATFGDPAVFTFGGKLRVVGLEFGSGFISYATNGLLTFGGNIDLNAGGLASMSAGIPTDPPDGPGFMDFGDGHFNIPLAGDLCIPSGCGGLDFGGKGVISSTGWAVCGEVGVSKAKVSAGLGQHWGHGIDVMGKLGGCDVSDYATTSRRRQGGAPYTVRVPGGLPQENILVQGTTGAPQVTVGGPAGAAEHTLIVPDPAAKQTYVYLARPPAGAYTIAPQPGSAPIASVSHANGLPAPKVTGRVTGHGYARRVHYRIAAITGQTVELYERSRKASTRIGAAKGLAGAVRFTPADGPAGTRQIVALVSQNGLPRRNLVIATYRAPGPRRPGRPRFARVRRAGGRVRVAWGAAPRAARYVVRIRLHDGTNQVFFATRSQRALTIPAVASATFGSVTVAGLTATSSRPGPAARATVKRKRSKHRRRH